MGKETPKWKIRAQDAFEFAQKNLAKITTEVPTIDPEKFENPNYEGWLFAAQCVVECTEPELCGPFGPAVGVFAEKVNKIEKMFRL